MLLIPILACFSSLVAAARRYNPDPGALVVSESPAPGEYGTVRETTTRKAPLTVQISAAVAALSTTSTADQAIFIRAGNYTEQVYIPARAARLRICGQTSDTHSYAANSVTITHGGSLLNGATNDDATATVRNFAANSSIYNVNIVNSYGKGSQALALSAEAGQQAYYGLQLRGYQDTLLAETGTQFYAQTEIIGAVDFVFGQHAAAWFEQVDLRLVDGGTVTAAAPSSSDTNSFVFDRCTIDAAAGSSVAPGSVYLGRPWSAYARVIFQDTTMSKIINSAGWTIWNNGDPRTSNVLFGEYSNTGDGASGPRASFATTVASPVSISSVLGPSFPDWVDMAYVSRHEHQA